jgi:CRP-like cAMP-binding protein
MDIYQHLTRHPAFGVANLDVVRKLCAHSDIRVFDAGANVVRAGDAQKFVLLLSEGHLRLYRRNRSARTEMLVGVLTAPAVFGDAELFGTASWTVSAQAASLTAAVMMPTKAFEKAVSADAALALALYKDACARHLLSVEIMQVLTLQNLEHKMLRLLHSAASLTSGSKRALVADVSQVELAKSLGVSTKTISRHLRRLIAEGFLKRHTRGYVLVRTTDGASLEMLETATHGAAWRLLGGR